jgi:hypothetical protein
LWTVHHGPVGARPQARQLGDFGDGERVGEPEQDGDHEQDADGGEVLAQPAG